MAGYRLGGARTLPILAGERISVALAAGFAVAAVALSYLLPLVEYARQVEGSPVERMLELLLLSQHLELDELEVLAQETIIWQGLQLQGRGAIRQRAGNGSHWQSNSY